MPALDIWEFAGFPLAHDVVPVAYRQLGQLANRGKVVELCGQERDAVFALEVSAVNFVRPKNAAGFRLTRSFLDLSPEIRRKNAMNRRGSGMRQTGHRTVATLRRYIRSGEIFRENAAAGLGI